MLLAEIEVLQDKAEELTKRATIAEDKYQTTQNKLAQV